ncbi:MAG: NAD-dependent epimerase/dehydratase family protein [Bacteroidales bacterium]
MLHIGITGQSGFIGSHLYNFFGLKKDEAVRIPFEDNYFEDTPKLEDFVKQCDVIIHLAALNRHNDPQTIYDTNILLIKKMIKALDSAGSRPHILFSSSTQEERDNMFGKSKKEGRELLAGWAKDNDAKFIGMIVPNVFGPFGNPYYNSVVATFSHQLTHNEEPKIEIDAHLKLIYIGELVELIWKAIKEKDSRVEYRIPYTAEKKVTEILELIKLYKTEYSDKGVFPSLNNKFEINLFNTFRCYMDIAGHYPAKLVKNTDDRGTFVETIKSGLGGQVSFSTTKPGITRGNHFHTRKIERFAVIKGKARIQLRRIGTDKVINFELDGNEPSYVDMPIWYTHNITNVGNEDLYTIFWIKEFFDPDDPDTFFEKV